MPTESRTWLDSRAKLVFLDAFGDRCWGVAVWGTDGQWHIPDWGLTLPEAVESLKDFHTDWTGTLEGFFMDPSVFGAAK